jgi:hypothetical protein
MDFKKFTQDLKAKTSPFLEKAKDYTKTYSEKALDFTAKQASTTPLFLSTEEAFNIHASAKRSILIAYDETDNDVKNILLLLPIWGSKAWMDNAELRYISLRENGDLAKTLKITWPIEMRIGYNGEQYLQTNNIKEIKEWWKNRCYIDKKNTEESQKKSEEDTVINDPLAQK